MPWTIVSTMPPSFNTTWMPRATPIISATLVSAAAPEPNSTAVRSGLMRAMMAMTTVRATKTAPISTIYQCH